MPVSSSWTNPSAAGTLDLSTGSVLTEGWTDAVASNFLWIGGTTGRVTQLGTATASTSGPTTTSTAYVDLPDMIVALTTTGGDLLVWITADISNSASGNFVGLAVTLDGGAEASPVNPTSPLANAVMTVNTFVRFLAPSSAAHTIRGRWQTQAGTATSPGGRRYMTVMEIRR